MLVIPAIDLKDGRCVRLYQGRADAATVYQSSPEETARRFVSEGAQWLHVVDLDGAFTGRPGNLPAIEAILRAISIPVQLGGGIRTLEDAERLLALGLKRIIIGTAALKDRPLLQTMLTRYGDRVAIGIDARDGRVATQGWTEQSHTEAVQLAAELDQLGVKTFIYTDIATDGTLTGPNVAETAALQRAVQAQVIASGGIGTLDDIHRLANQGIQAAIVGKALYSGRFALADAIRAGGGHAC